VNTVRTKVGVAAVAAVASLLALPGAASATVLTFEILTGATPVGFRSLETEFGAYGDNVASTSTLNGGYTFNYLEGNGFTPNVVVGYSHIPAAGGLGQHHYNTEGDWADSVDYLHFEDNALFSIVLTPDAGYGVNLESFMLDLYTIAPEGGVDFTWTARADHDAGAVLASGSLLDVQLPNDEQTATVNASHTGKIVLHLSFTNAGFGGIVGIDDLSFTQFAIPEPASLALLAGGAAVMLRRKRT
jgi:hypothetical protein